MPQSEQGPIFVVGHPRSGTTLVQLLITATGEAGSAPETHFFTYVMEPFASSVPLEYLGHSQRGPLNPDPIAQIQNRLAEKPGIVLDAEERTQLAARIKRDPTDPFLVLDSLMQILVERTGSSGRWLEKTPRHFFFVDEILRLYPRGRIVYVVRDPRDVVSSPVKFQRLEPGAERWAQGLALAQSWVRSAERAVAARSRDRCWVLRYEDLIRDPIQHLGVLLEFLDIEAGPAKSLEGFADHYGNTVLSQEEVRKGLLAQGELLDRRGIWKQRMTLEEADLVVGLASGLMEDLGYVD